MSQVPPPPSYPGSPQMAGYTPGGAKPKGMSITALVLGILSFFTCCVGVNYVNLGMFVAIAAVIVGYLARQKVARGEQGGGGMATAGFILGIVNLIIQIIAIVLVLAFGVSIMNWAQQKQAELEKQGQSTVVTPSDTTDDVIIDDTSTTAPAP